MNSSSIKGFCIVVVNRFLIVIDDIWDTSNLGDIKNVLMSGSKQNRILVTSRKTLKTQDIDEDYGMRKLSPENSRILFYTIIYGDKWPDDLVNKSAEISDKIFKRCDGLPFAIVIIASLLATKKDDIEKWSDVYESIGFENGNGVNYMMKILSYSYYDLPPHLKKCLLHLSVYPEDVKIAKVPLIWKWIGEGLVVDEKGIGLFQVGEIYFQELMDRSMILPVESAFSYQDCCYVHDIVLHMIRDLSRQQNFAVLLDGRHLALPKGNARCRRLAMTNVCNKETGGAIREESKTIRSFNATASHIDNMLPPLYSFDVLRVLSLEVCHITEGKMLKDLGKLTCLRYLGIICTPIRELPEEVRRLKHLQALRLKGTCIKILPASVGDLTQLLCLSVDGKTRIPRFIGKMPMLVHLEFDLETDDVSAMDFVTDLGKQTELTRVSTMITVKSVELRWALLKSLGKLHKVEILNLGAHTTVLMTDNANLDGDFSLSKSIRLLKLMPFGFSKLPAWINSSHLPNLCDLFLILVSVDKKAVHTLGELGKLRSLILFVMDCPDDGGIITCAGGAFPKLQRCEMNMPLKFDEAAMPRLEYLKFRFMLVPLKDDYSFDFNFGLQNLHSLQHVVAEIDCTRALPEELDHVIVALLERVQAHRNPPTMEVQGSGAHLVSTGADSNMLIRKKRMMHVLRHRLEVQDSWNYELQRETQELIRLVPRGHPYLLELCQMVTPSRFLLKLRLWYLAQLQLKLLADHFDDTKRRATREYKGENEKHIDNLHELMEMVSGAERALKILKEENQTSSELLAELKSSLKQLRAVDHDDQEEDTETTMQDSSIDGYEEVSELEEDTGTEIQDSSIDGHEEVSEPESGTESSQEDSCIDGHEEVSESESGTESFQEDVDLDFAVGLGNVELLKQVVVSLGRTDLAAYYSALPQAQFVSTQLAVQRNLLYELNRQTAEVTRSIPRGILYHFELCRLAPSRFFPKLRHWYSALLQERPLQQHLADTLNRASRGHETIGNLHRLMQNINAAEQAVEIYTTRNRRSSAMLEEMKSSLSHLRSVHFNDEEPDDDAGVAALAGDVLFCLNATKTFAIRWLWGACVAPVTEAVRCRFRKIDNVRAGPATS